MMEAAELPIASKIIQALWGEAGDDFPRRSTASRFFRSWMRAWQMALGASN